MEKVTQLESAEISEVIGPTMSAFVPLLEKKRTEIQEIPKKTFKYGITDRHQLDVYYPVSLDGSGKTRVLVWVYGGGFTTGDRQMAAPFDLVYGCVGAYFARRGFVTIIPDYRLSPGAIFPSAAEDVRDAVLWAIRNTEHLVTHNSPNPDTQSIFLMGHSAGATHVFSALALPETEKSAVLLPHIAGAILCAGGYHSRLITPKSPIFEAVQQHWGGEEGVKENDPMGLLRRAPKSTIKALPRIALVVGEREPGRLLQVNDDFAEALEASTGSKPEKIVAKGHNHVSTNIALGTGEGEEWAEDVITWIKKS